MANASRALVPTLLVLLAACACAGAKKSGGKLLSITVLEKSTRNTRLIALSMKLPTPGDRFIWQWDVVTPKAGRKIGYDSGMCTALFNGMNQCSWTTFLKKGSISASGIIDDNKIKNVVPITGGTGSFSGASGNISQYTLVTNPAQAEYQYLETFNVRLPEKPAGVAAIK